MSKSKESFPKEVVKRTVLYDKHKALGARFTAFAGWEMPIQYAGVGIEHRAVRENVGLFDVSHMGEIVVSGPDAESFLQNVTSNDVSRLEVGTAQYSLLLNETGGVLDDIIVYLLGESEYLLCVNASNTDSDFSWLLEQKNGDLSIENKSSSYAQLALQGPRARALLKQLLELDSDDDYYSRISFPPFSFREEVVPGFGSLDTSVLIACTGYTGEDGFEIFCANSLAPDLWDKLIELGQNHGIEAVGLGARDTLRLEVCYPLHGHELTPDIPALACGVGWVVKFAKGDFIGAKALQESKAAGFSQVLVGFEVSGRGVVRAGDRVFSGAEEIGWISSGTKTPCLERAVGLGFVPKKFASVGSELEADVRGRRVEIKVVNRPFYVKGA